MSHNNICPFGTASRLLPWTRDMKSGAGVEHYVPKGTSIGIKAPATTEELEEGFGRGGILSVIW